MSKTFDSIKRGLGQAIQYSAGKCKQAVVVHDFSVMDVEIEREKISFISREKYQQRVLSIARGTHKPASTEPRVWVESIPSSDTVPHEVMRYVLRENVTLPRAWREYLGFAQADVAVRMGITQSALAQMENTKRPRKATLEKLATALGVSVSQLI